MGLRHVRLQMPVQQRGKQMVSRAQGTPGDGIFLNKVKLVFAE